jgi:hypothetical protein
LASQSVDILFDSHVLDELAAVIGYFSEMVGEIHDV